MAQTVSILARIDALEAAKLRIYTAPDLATVSFMPMADLLGVSRVTLRGWCDRIPAMQDSDAFIRGGNGIEWQFNPRKTVDALLAHFHGEQGKRQDANAKIVAATGIDLGDGPAPDLSDLKRQVDLTMSIVEMKQRQGRYIPAEDVRAFLQGYNQRAVHSIMGIRAQIDPTGALPADTARLVNDGLVIAATQLNTDCLNFIEERCAGIDEDRNQRRG